MTYHAPARRAKKTRRPLRILVAIVTIPVLAFGVLFAASNLSQLAPGLFFSVIFAQVAPTIDHIKGFPSRAIPTSSASNLPAALDDRTLEAFERIDMQTLGPGMPAIDSQGALDQFLNGTETTAFLVLQDGVLVHQWYAPGVDPDALHTSFLVSKSFLSTLIRIAIDEGNPYTDTHDPAHDAWEALDSAEHDVKTMCAYLRKYNVDLSWVPDVSAWKPERRG